MLLSNYYSPHWTGLVQYAISLAEGLVKEHFGVEVWTIGHKFGLLDKETINGVNISRAKALKKISRTWISLEFVLKMQKKIANSDRVLVILPMSEAIWATLLAKLYKKPIYLIHNGDLKLTGGIINNLIEKIFFLTTDLAIKTATGIIVNTTDYAKNSKLLLKNKDKWIELIPPFVPLIPIKEDIDEIKNRIGKASFVVGFAGRFVQEKGFDILLKAIPIVEKQRPGTKFIFAGEVKIDYENTFNDLREEWNKQLKNIVSLGKIERPMMGSFYAVCDTFVISSRSDFFPFTQAEALLAGIPVVVTDIPGARWPVTVTKMGLVVCPESPEDLARGIIEALDRKSQMLRNYDKVKTFFDYNKVIKKYTELLK